MYDAKERAQSRRRLRAIGIAVAWMVMAGAIASPARAEGDVPTLAFERYTLDNGIEVILHQDRRVPLVAVDVWYHVGAGNEVVGRSGFAHLFEHMLFQGSKHVGEDRHFEILKNIGGAMVNGTTNSDRTNYFEVVPSHQLETALWLESDRMGYMLPLLTQQSLDNQIEVVRNERRQRVENVPYGTTYLAVAENLYPEGHPYRYTTIGKHEDLVAATLEDVRNFYKQWYVPANATLALAGDFDMAEARRLIETWFGSFPASTRPSAVAPPTPVVKRKRVEVKDRLAKLRMITYAWITPAAFAEGNADLDLLADMLGAEGTGRLYQTLVHTRQLAQSVRVYQQSQGFSSVFSIQVMVRSDADAEQVERIIHDEINRVRKKPVSKRELDRAITRVESRFIWGLESLLARAELLQRYNHYTGTPEFIAQDLARYRKATPDTVRALAETYLGRERRVEIITVPAEEKSR